MSTKRTKTPRGTRARLTPEVIAAWHRCDNPALRRLLGLKLCDPNVLPPEIEGYAASYAGASTDPRIVALRAALLATAGWPSDCRASYEKNLTDAITTRDYYHELIEHPERGGTGTGCDPESRLRALAEAEDKIAYRRELLADLEQQGMISTARMSE